MAATALQPVREAALEPTLQVRLRAATRDAHEAVDAHYSRFDLAGPQGYRDFLAMHATIMPHCEAVLDLSGAVTLLPDWNERRRTPALLADLTALDCAVAHATYTLEPLAAPEAWGMLYVLEGSRLGGAVLAGRLRANPDACCRHATRYLRHGHGARLWTKFLLAFEHETVASLQFERVVAGALQTFSLFTGTG